MDGRPKDEEVDELQSPAMDVAEDSKAAAKDAPEAKMGGQAHRNPAQPSSPTHQQHQQQQQHANPTTSTGGPICANCSTQTTSLWRRSPDGQTLCNACSLYQKMKGCPRPVSLKTDVIKHRNRSKGDKKLKEGAHPPGQPSSQHKPPKGKKPSARAPSVGGSTRNSSPAMMDDVEEAEEEDLLDNDNAEDDMVDDSAHTQPSANGLPPHAGKRPRASLGDLSHDPRYNPNAHPPPTHPAQPHSSYKHQHHQPAVHRPHQTITAALEARQQARQRELAAAAALADASNAASNRRSISVDGRSTPTSSDQHHRTDIPFNLASLFSGIIRNDAAHRDGKPIYPFMQKQSPAGSAQSSPGTSSAPPPAFQPILPHHIFQQQRARAAAAAAAASAGSSAPSSAATSKDPSLSPEQMSYKNYSPRIVSRTDPRSHSTTPTESVPSRPAPFGLNPHAAPNGKTSPNPPSHSGMDSAASQQQQQPSSVTSRFAPAALSLPSGHPASIHRATSSDRLSASRSRAFASVPPSATSNAHAMDHTEEERERQRARLDQLFAAANQRLHEGSRKAEQERGGLGSAPGGPDSHPSGETSASAEERIGSLLRGRANSSTHHSHGAGYRPYELPRHRSSSRMGQQVSVSDSRFPSVLAGQRNSPQNSAAINSFNAKTGRPGSSASSSSDSNPAGDIKKGMTSITSPPMAPYVSPPLHTAPAPDSMAIDEADPVSAAPSTHASASPPFGHDPSPVHALPPLAGGLSASERRGRSMTRKHRDNEVGDVVAEEMRAMRMRDTSRSSYRSSSPHVTTNSYLSSFPGSRIPPATIKTAELDDGIVRDAVTHRPISDLRASDSPHTLPSLSSALSSSTSSRSLSARSGSRHSVATRHSAGTTTMGEDLAGPVLPLPNSGYEEVQRLRTRIQELEFINGLMESRVAELEHSRAFPPHGQSCLCRCAEISESEAQKAAEHLKLELAAHGIKGLGEQASRDLLDLLTQRLGYRLGDLK